MSLPHRSYSGLSHISITCHYLTGVTVSYLTSHISITCHFLTGFTVSYLMSHISITCHYLTGVTLCYLISQSCVTTSQELQWVIACLISWSDLNILQISLVDLSHILPPPRVNSELSHNSFIFQLTNWSDCLSSLISFISSARSYYSKLLGS